MYICVRACGRAGVRPCVTNKIQEIFLISVYTPQTVPLSLSLSLCIFIYIYIYCFVLCGIEFIHLLTSQKCLTKYMKASCDRMLFKSKGIKFRFPWILGFALEGLCCGLYMWVDIIVELLLFPLSLVFYAGRAVWRLQSAVPSLQKNKMLMKQADIC